MSDTVSVKLTVETRKMLRLLAAYADDSIQVVAEKIVAEALRREQAIVDERRNVDERRDFFYKTMDANMESLARFNRGEGTL